MTYPSVEAAIAAAYAHTGLRAIDPEAMALHTTRERPVPGRKLTVRASGREGGYVPSEPTGAVERARIRRLLATLPMTQQILVVCYAVGIPQRYAVAYAREKGGHFTNGEVGNLRETGLARLRGLFLAVGLVEAA